MRQYYFLHSLLSQEKNPINQSDKNACVRTAGLPWCAGTETRPQITANLDIAGNDGVLNATLVGASEDLEQTVLAPGRVPGVDAQPVRSAVLNTPADHLHGVAAEVLAGHVLVHTGRVSLEILVHSEGHGHSALLHDLLLHVGSLHGVRSGREVLVLGVGDAVASIRASGSALGGLVLLEVGASRHAAGGLNVVSARLHGVRLAGGAGVDVSVVTAGGHTGLGEPLPGSGGLATVAAHGKAAVQAGAASKGVLSREHGLGIASLDAHTVVEGLGGAESPAGAAVTLVADAAGDGSALRPSGADIEGLRDGRVRGREHGLLNLGLVEALLATEHGAEHKLDIGNGGVGESLVHGSLPGGGLGLLKCKENHKVKINFKGNTTGFLRTLISSTNLEVRALVE